VMRSTPDRAILCSVNGFSSSEINNCHEFVTSPVTCRISHKVENQRAGKGLLTRAHFRGESETIERLSEPIDVPRRLLSNVQIQIFVEILRKKILVALRGV